MYSITSSTEKSDGQFGCLTTYARGTLSVCMHACMYVIGALFSAVYMYEWMIYVCMYVCVPLPLRRRAPVWRWHLWRHPLSEWAPPTRREAPATIASQQSIEYYHEFSVYIYMRSFLYFCKTCCNKRISGAFQVVLVYYRPVAINALLSALASITWNPLYLMSSFFRSVTYIQPLLSKWPMSPVCMNPSGRIVFVVDYKFDRSILECFTNLLELLLFIISESSQLWYVFRDKTTSCLLPRHHLGTPASPEDLESESKYQNNVLNFY